MGSNCTDLKRICNATGPVSVALDAGGSEWQSYSSGVITSCGTSINHGVLLVGFTPSAWKIKNSWGVGWGQSGFGELANCGICIWGGEKVYL